MRIDIKLSNRVRKRNRECFGLTRILSGHRAIIYISKRANTEPGQYALTLIHEFLHVWIAMLQAAGSSIDLRRDHTFIYAVERSICKLSKLLLKKKKQS